MSVKHMLRGCARGVRNLLNPIPDCYGADFHQYYESLRESQWWEPSKLVEYQNKQVAKLVKHCYDNVQYYRELFDQHGFKPWDIETVADLKKLPYLTKEIIRENSHKLIARNCSKKNMEFNTTGGTSGSPLGIYLEKRTNLIRCAFEWRFFNWGEYCFRDKCVVLRGRVVTDFGGGRRWEYDPFNNYLVLSTFDMTESNMRLYLRKIKDFRPKVIQGYPSALERLAHLALDEGVHVNESGNIRAVFTSSETIYPYQRLKIKEAFEAEIFDLYGNTEQAGRFGECECHEGLHDFSEYGVTEIINERGAGTGEIIATTFTNYAMPLIRYRTGDCGRWSSKQCSCRRGLPLIMDLEGRLQDILILRDGTPVPFTSFFFAVHVPEMALIRRIQFKQEEPGCLEVRVVKGRDYRQGACESMLRKMNENLREKLTLNIRYVTDIELTAAGKHRFFIQTLETNK